MKKIVVLASGLLLLLIAFTYIGCSSDNVSPSPGAQVASSCVSCHTDKELLQQLAVEEEESGETTGEG